MTDIVLPPSSTTGPAPGGSARRRNLSPWRWFVANVADAVEQRAAGAPGTLALPDRVGSKAEFSAWQRRARAELNRLLGPLPASVPPNVETIESVDCGSYQRDLLVFDSEPHQSVSAYLLVPHDRRARGRPGPAILAQHGHGPGKDEVCKVGAAGEEGGGDEGNAPNTYGHELAERGYVVLAPDLRTFGARADWEPPDIYACNHAYTYAAMLGHNLLALDLWDLARSLDVLGAHPLVNPRRMGMVGLSQGGTCTLFLAAWDRRIRAAVVSGYFNTWEACATIDWNMCGSQVLAGIIGRLDHVDLGALIAPRALLIETGSDDAIFPAPAAAQAAERLRRVYSTAEHPERIEHDLFEGAHRWHGAQAYPFLERWLGRPRPPAAGARP